MAKRISLMCDLSSLFRTVGFQHPRRKLSYKKLLAFCAELGEVKLQKAYGLQENKEASKFIAALQHLGFSTHYKRIGPSKQHVSWNIAMTITAIHELPEYDTLILASAEHDLWRLIRYIREAHNKQVIVIACNIPTAVKNVATSWFEVTESMLEEPNGLAKGTQPNIDSFDISDGATFSEDPIPGCANQSEQDPKLKIGPDTGAG